MGSKPRTLKRIMPMLGLALVAALALSVVGVASASAAIPKNTVLPVVSPATPLLGGVETTTTGTWTESPTSYEYRWFRCNASGIECLVIPQQSTSTYTTVEVDIGHTLKAEVTAINASGSAFVQSKPTNVLKVSPRSWYVAGSKLAPGSIANLITKKLGFEPFHLKWTIGTGLHYTVSCTSETIQGEIENRVSGGAGQFGPKGSLLLSGCTFEPRAMECKVHGAWDPAGQISSVPLQGEATEFNGYPAVKFKPSTGTNLFTLVFTGCRNESINGNYIFNGSLTGVGKAGTSLLTFGPATSSLYLGLVAATFSGESQMETSAGASVEVKP
jgi:hypothetical protein